MVEDGRHKTWMRRCLELAERGLGSTAPNPLVGCVIVQQNRIIGEGWHQKYGGPHAEVAAVAATGLSRLPADAVVYVNLEPCAHFGKTPPCANMLLEFGAKHVVTAMQDPFPAVHGKGLHMLRNAGVVVETDVLSEEARWLNRRFLCAVTQMRPWIILKWAETADGFMADLQAQRRQISGAAAQVLLHRWRSEEGAFLVGRKTALSDRAFLTNRFFGNRQPLRVVADPQLALNLDLPIFQAQAKTWILNEHKSHEADHLRWVAYGSDFFEVLFARLLEAGIQSLVVEGGPETLQRFIAAGFVDEIRIIRSKKHYWGSGIPAPVVHGTLKESMQLKEDEVLTFAV